MAQPASRSRQHELLAAVKATRSSVLGQLLFALIFAALFVIALRWSLNDDNAGRAIGFFSTIGVLAVWRYGWWATHLVRARRYLKKTFPALRKAADEAHAERRLAHIYVVITSYFIDEDKTFNVYRSLIAEAAEYGQNATLVSAITDEVDVETISRAYEACGAPRNVEVVLQYQKGDGKRSAMAEALRVISRRLPGPDSVVVLMDGDIQLEAGALDKTAGFFVADPELGALTTDNEAIAEGGGWTREWFSMRYAQRHIIMSSLSLSERVLVLTGRFSMFRADLAVDPDFIARIESDTIKHWRFGEIKLLSGDDKSSWYHLLKDGERMLYIPDVKAVGYEKLPDGEGFLSGSTLLMRRWFRNMLQSNGRAVLLGPRPMGVYVWWSILDQRLSIWSTLAGPIIAGMLAYAYTPAYLVYYLVWIMATRTISAAIIGLNRGRVSTYWPVLLYYNQVYGALIKVYSMFRLNRQKWTRQNIDGSLGSQFQEGLSSVLNVAAILVLIYLLALGTGLLNVPGERSWILWRIPFWGV